MYFDCCCQRDTSLKQSYVHGALGSSRDEGTHPPVPHREAVRVGTGKQMWTVGNVRLICNLEMSPATRDGMGFYANTISLQGI